MAGKGNSILTQLLFNIACNTAELKTGLAEANASISKFSANVQKIAGAIGLAFSAKELLSFGVEVSKLAGEFKGVESAYKKIQGSEQLMINLKRATAGTVSELDLMKRAVAFSNFGLELNQLPKLLEFATKRAAETGQSVDYLVDSIVTGLGRKSVLILDNLGISASQINAEFAKTGDFVGAVSKIVDSELTKMGDLVETTMTKTERLSAAWTNYKIAVGEAMNETGFFAGLLDGMSDALQVAGSKNLSFWQKAGALMSAANNPAGIYVAKLQDTVAELQKAADAQKKQEQVTREVDRAYLEFNKNLDSYAKTITTHQYRTELIVEFTRRLNAEEQKRLGAIENISNLQAKLNDLQAIKINQTGQELIQTNQEIKAIEGKIKKLNELGVAEQEARKLTPISDSVLNYGKEMSQYKPKEKSTTERLGSLVNIDSTKLANDAFAQLNAQVDAHNEKLVAAQQNYAIMGETIGDVLLNNAAEGIWAIDAALSGMIEGQKGAMKGLVSSILDGIRQVIMGLFAQAIAGMIAGESKKGIVGLALAAIGVAGLTALWKSKVPNFATGGVTARNGMAVVGEYGPEVVNLPAGSRVYNHNQSKSMLNNAGAMRVEVVGQISNDVIYLANARAGERRRNTI